MDNTLYDILKDSTLHRYKRYNKIELKQSDFSTGTYTIDKPGIYILTENISFLPLAFDVMSALANCGWSQGITSEISKIGALILTILMFVGRLGSLYIALSIPDTPQRRYQFPEETVRIG